MTNKLRISIFSFFLIAIVVSLYTFVLLRNNVGDKISLLNPDDAAKVIMIRFPCSGEVIEAARGDPEFDDAMKMLCSKLPKQDVATLPREPKDFLYLQDATGKVLFTVKVHIGSIELDGKAVRDYGILDRFNQLCSKYIYQYPNGSIRAKGIHDKGLKSGEWEFYYQSGGVEWKGSFNHGTKVGIWEHFDEKGDQLESVDFDHRQPRLLQEHRRENSKVSGMCQE